MKLPSGSTLGFLAAMGSVLIIVGKFLAGQSVDGSDLTLLVTTILGLAHTRP